MIVHVYTRHSRKCPHRSDPQYKRCRCVKWVYYNHGGRQYRESTKLTSFDSAMQFARRIEERYEQAATGDRPDAGAVEVREAVRQYLNDKRTQGLRWSTLRKRKQWFETELLFWCTNVGIRFVSELTLDRLRAWRATWELGALTAAKKQESLRQFMTFCVTNGWISQNPARGLSKIIVNHNPTLYFDDHEMEKILKATGEDSKLRALVLLMRWSGLAIRDAVTLDRERLNEKDQIFLYRAKTGTPVYVTIPRDIAQELRDLPIGRYFFWTGKGAPETAVKHWHKKFANLFKRAKLKNLDGTSKQTRPHMFRDTFAVNLLLQDVPIEDVSVLLGHNSVRTTEKHYAPFVRARQEKLDAHVRRTFPK